MATAVERFAARLIKLENRINGLATGPQLGHSSLEDGSLEEYDGDGQLVTIIGKQPDGTHGAVVVSGPVPPRPSAAVVSGGPGLLNYGWDGNFADEGTGKTDISIPAPMDWARTEAHASKLQGFSADTAATLLDTLESPRGGTRTAMLEPGTWFVVLVSRASSGKRSKQSLEVGVEVLPPVGSDIDVEALKEEFRAVDADMNAAIQQNRVDQATLAGTVSGLRDTVIPGLNTDLALAAERLASAEKAITTAIPSQINTAKQAAVTAAAADATAKKEQAEANAATDAKAKADKALADAKVDASSKANAAEAAAKTAAAADAKSKTEAAEARAASTAAADAKAKADAAQSAALAAAKIYADAQASGAQGAALEAAKADATAKADAAKAAAITAAAADATSKKEQAEATAAADAKTKADKALADAKVDAQAKATAAQAAAVAAAAADATAKKEQAEANAALDAKNKADKALADAKADATTKANAAKAAAISAAASDAQTKADAAIAEALRLYEKAISSGSNMAADPSFEDGLGAYFNSTYFGTSTRKVAAGQARTGAAYLEVVQGSVVTDGPSVRFRVSGITPGRVYAISAWVYRQTGGGSLSNSITGYFLNSAGTSLGWAPYVDAPMSLGTWSQAGTQEPWLAPAGAASLEFRVNLGGAGLSPGGISRVDDIAVYDVTDAKVALDAAKAAQATASAAQAAAGTAGSNATAALTMAGSKSKVYYNTTAATGTATGDGDLWRQRDSSNNIIAEWRWNGTPPAGSWIKTAISSDAISNLDVGKLSVGSAVIQDLVAQKIAASTAAFQKADIGNLIVTGSSALNTLTAQRIAANVGQFLSVTTDQLTAGKASLGTAVADKFFAEIFATRKLYANQIYVGQGGNLFTGADFTDPGWQSHPDIAFSGTGGKTGGSSMVIGASTAQVGSYFGSLGSQRQKAMPLEAGAKYKASAWVRSSAAAGAGMVRIYLRAYRPDGSYLWADPSARGNGSIIPANTWAQVDGEFTAPDEANLVGVLGFYVQPELKAAVRFSDPAIAPMITPSLIVDGLMNGQRIVGASIETNAASMRGIKLIDSGLNAWDPSGKLTFRLNSETGTLFASGDFESTSNGVTARIGRYQATNSITRPALTFQIEGSADQLPPQVFAEGAAQVSGSFGEGALVAFSGETTVNSSGRSVMLLKRGGGGRIATQYGPNEGTGFHFDGSLAYIAGQIPTTVQPQQQLRIGYGTQAIIPRQNYLEWTVTQAAPPPSGIVRPWIQLEHRNNLGAALSPAINTVTRTGFKMRVYNPQATDEILEYWFWMGFWTPVLGA